MMSTAKTYLRMAEVTLLLALQYLDNKHVICKAIINGNWFFDVALHYSERRLFSCPIFLSEGLIMIES